MRQEFIRAACKLSVQRCYKCKLFYACERPGKASCPQCAFTEVQKLKKERNALERELRKLSNPCADPVK